MPIVTSLPVVLNVFVMPHGSRHGEVDSSFGAPSPLATSPSQTATTLEQLELPPAVAVVSDRFEDGRALWGVVVERGLEGVVAKRLDGRYVPGEGGWVKTKNRETWWRYELARVSEFDADRRWRDDGNRHECWRLPRGHPVPRV